MRITVSSCDNYFKEGVFSIVSDFSNQFISDAKKDISIIIMDLRHPGYIKGLRIQSATYVILISAVVETGFLIDYLSAHSRVIFLERNKDKLFLKAFIHGCLYLAMTDSEFHPSGKSLPRKPIKISKRELVIKNLLLKGMSFSEIAIALELSIKTVYTFRGILFSKLCVSNTSEFHAIMREKKVIDCLFNWE